MRDKTKLILSIIFMALGFGLLIVSGFVEESAGVLYTVIMLVTGLVFAFGGVALAVAADYSSGEYICRSCGKKFKPTLSQYIWGAHTLTKRRLKCPCCGEKNWCKRISATN